MVSGRWVAKSVVGWSVIGGFNKTRLEIYPFIDCMFFQNH